MRRARRAGCVPNVRRVGGEDVACLGAQVVTLQNASCGGGEKGVAPPAPAAVAPSVQPGAVFCSPDGDCTPSACFVAGTLVQTARGPRAIESILVGDEVLAEDPVVRETAPRAILTQFVTEQRPVVRLRFALPNGTEAVVRATREHPFWVENVGWIAAGDLRVEGDRVRAREGLARVVEAATEPGLHTVYNLEVDRVHTYLVSELGLLVHNQYAPTPSTSGKGTSVGPAPADPAATTVTLPIRVVKNLPPGEKIRYLIAPKYVFGLAASALSHEGLATSGQITVSRATRGEEPVKIGTLDATSGELRFTIDRADVSKTAFSLDFASLASGPLTAAQKKHLSEIFTVYVMKSGWLGEGIAARYEGGGK